MWWCQRTPGPNRPTWRRSRTRFLTCMRGELQPQSDLLYGKKAGEKEAWQQRPGRTVLRRGETPVRTGLTEPAVQQSISTHKSEGRKECCAPTPFLLRKCTSGALRCSCSVYRGVLSVSVPVQRCYTNMIKFNQTHASPRRERPWISNIDSALCLYLGTGILGIPVSMRALRLSLPATKRTFFSVVYRSPLKYRGKLSAVR